MIFDRKQVKFSDWFLFFPGLPAKQILPDTAAVKSSAPEVKSKLLLKIWKTQKVSWFHHFFWFSLYGCLWCVLRQPKKLENYVVWRRKINNLEKWIKEVGKESKMLKTFALNHDSSATWFRSTRHSSLFRVFCVATGDIFTVPHSTTFPLSFNFKMVRGNNGVEVIGDVQLSHNK